MNIEQKRELEVRRLELERQHRLLLRRISDLENATEVEK